MKEMRELFCVFIEYIQSSTIGTDPQLSTYILINVLYIITGYTCLILFAVLIAYKSAGSRIKQIHSSSIRAYPYILIPVFINSPGIITAKTGNIGRIVLKMAVCILCFIIYGYPVTPGTYPYISFAVFLHA